ncbi:hypothetical protein ES288_A12G138800v1 [Gossypium darwinii]|uniref:Uncharacterized protein n=1 Tax=Gossypium darwinii TaxID=34276 RepID=A0A5D2E995_GOSDA|nr:hypothetical protein ES288_A12G138800v1 [Gossypium darwinii]
MDTTILTESTTGKFFNPFAFASQKKLLEQTSSVTIKSSTYTRRKIQPHRVCLGLMYEQQNSTLCVWLLSTVSASLHNQLIGSLSSAFEFWFGHLGSLYSRPAM